MNLDRGLAHKVAMGELSPSEADRILSEQHEWKVGLGMAEHKERDWIWPNRKADLDCLALSLKDQALLKQEAKDNGLLEGLPSLKLGNGFQPNDFLDEMPKEHAEAMGVVERAWLYGSAASDAAIAYAWHLWRERIPRWESTSNPSVDWSVDWYRETGGCGGMLVYNTWISVHEIERYWLNWLVRCNGWLNQLSQRERLTEFGEDKSQWAKLTREMAMPLQWYESQSGIRLQEVTTKPAGFERDGVQFGGWSFTRDELLMRYDESNVLYQACLLFKANAEGRAARKVANRLANKILNTLQHRLTPSYGFIIGKLETYPGAVEHHHS